MNNLEDKFFLSRFTAGVLTSYEIIEFANNKLDEGTYSENLLSIVDEKNSSTDRLIALFKKWILEKQLTLPSLNDSIFFLLNYHIEKIANSENDPFEQFKLLLNDIKAINLHSNIKEFVGDALGIEKMYALFYEHFDSNTKSSSENETMKKFAREWLMKKDNYKL